MPQVKDTERCVRIIYSHTRVKEKNLLVIKLLKRASRSRRLIMSLSSILEKFADFTKNEYSELAHLARKLLIEAETPTYTEIKIRVIIPHFIFSFRPNKFYVEMSKSNLIFSNCFLLLFRYL